MAMRRSGALLIFAVLALVVGAIIIGHASAQDPDRTLVGASPKAIGERGVLIARSRFRTSGNPVVLLSHPLTSSADLPPLGIDPPSFVCAEPPLALVILRGNFDINGAFPGGRLAQTADRYPLTHFVAFVMDLRAGLPAVMEFGVTGGKFRRALNDPTLPEEPKADVNTIRQVGEVPAVAVTPFPTTVATCAYGSIVPTAAPPKR
jgi:hypothetical protein